jgi:hypothetical protein
MAFTGDGGDPAYQSLPELGADDFARRFSMRSWNVMWFLGAGVSAAGGIPTAGDMIWDFKQKLFVSQRHVAPELVADLSSPAVREQLQAHIDSAGNLPTAGTPDEYSALFEAVFPSESDRRSYIDGKVAAGRPSYGHLALATLMRSDHARLVWTTNFDAMVADACAKAFEGTSALTTVNLNAPEIARQAINEERWPTEVKLHGDFRSRQLKNTTDELREQDHELRDILLDCTKRLGLIVAGYSGRDDSIMSTLEAATGVRGAFPAGLFWLHRGDDDPYGRVADLLRKAQASGVEAALVRIQSFDEAMRDLIRLVPNLNMKVLEQFAKTKASWSAAPAPTSKGGWPVLRFNALGLQDIPTVCRRVSCTIGGAAEVQSAVEKSGRDLLAVRRKVGVMAFGRDVDVRAVFDPYRITEFDLAHIDQKRLRYDSAERGMLRQALVRAIARERNMTVKARRSADLLYPTDPDATAFDGLRRIVGTLTGTVNGIPELTWFEGVALRLEWTNDLLWLVFDPTIGFEGTTQENRAAAADFGREHTFDRYNPKLNDLIEFWAGLLREDGQPLRALNIADGVDAAFTFIARTAFSRRATA